MHPYHPLFVFYLSITLNIVNNHFTKLTCSVGIYKLPVEQEIVKDRSSGEKEQSSGCQMCSKFQRFIGYEFEDEDLFCQAINKNSDCHSKWAEEGDVLFKRLLLDSNIKRDAKKLLETNDLFGSFMIS